MYDILNPYIGIDEKTKDMLLVIKSVNKLSKNEYCVERLNYILQIFLDKDEITKFLIRYFKHRKMHWKDVKDHLHTMCADLLLYSLNKITISIQ